MSDEGVPRLSVERWSLYTALGFVVGGILFNLYEPYVYPHLPLQYDSLSLGIQSGLYVLPIALLQAYALRSSLNTHMQGLWILCTIISGMASGPLMGMALTPLLRIIEGRSHEAMSSPLIITAWRILTYGSLAGIMGCMLAITQGYVLARMRSRRIPVVWILASICSWVVGGAFYGGIFIWFRPFNSNLVGDILFESVGNMVGGSMVGVITGLCIVKYACDNSGQRAQA